MLICFFHSCIFFLQQLTKSPYTPLSTYQISRYVQEDSVIVGMADLNTVSNFRGISALNQQFDASEVMEAYGVVQFQRHC